MTTSYTISITRDVPGGSAVLAHVEIEPGRCTLTEISVRIGEDAAPLPKDLGLLDITVLIETAVALSEGRLPTRFQPEPPAHAGDETTSAAGTVPAQATARRRRATPAQKNGAPSDLPLIYWRLGSVAKVAAHYDVTRQIARDWIRSVRKQGSLPNPWSASGRS